MNAVLVAALQDVINDYEKEAKGFFSISSSESKRVVEWLKNVVATDARNVRIAILPGVSRVQQGDSHLLWALKYYVNGRGESAEGAPLVRLNAGGRLHKMLAEVVAKGEKAAEKA